MTTMGTGQLLDLLEGVPFGVVAFDHEWRIQSMNSAGARLLQREPSDLLGRIVWEEFPEATETIAYREYHRAVAQQEVVSFELFYGPLTGWFEATAIPTATGLIVSYRDVTASRRRDIMLSGSRAALAQIASDAPLPEVLDVLVEMVERESLHGAIASILLLDPSGRHLLHGSAPSLPTDYNEAIDGIEIGPSVGSCGTAAYFGVQVIAEDIREDERWVEFRELADAAGLRACWSTPIPSADGQLLGTFAVYYREPRRPEPDDAEMIEQVTRTAAIAIQHDRDREALREAATSAQALAAATREVAHVLQDSLLTLPPTVPGLQIAVRYQAAEEAAEVGGDWYDAISLPNGALGVSVGDVIGHDLRAAATMGQLRNLLRASACEATRDPAQVLAHLDDLVDTLDISHLATAVYGEVRLPAQGERDGLLRWSNAGHPAPALLGPEGRAVLLQGTPGLPLSVDRRARRSVEQTVLPVGSTLVLYTDGLVERRTEHIDQSQQRLLRRLEDHGSLALEELADRLLDLVEEQTDDIALLLVRLTG